MPQQVCMGAMMTCSFGTAPSSLIVIRPTILVSKMPMANIMDNKPIANIPPFAMCNSVVNPATKRPPPVFFTPAPCVPVVAAPWAPGVPTVLVDNMPSLDNTCKAMCNWGGVISFTMAGQMQCEVS